MTTAQPFPLKHIGSFTLLFLLSVLRPAAIWPDIPFSFAPLTVLALGFLLLYKINATLGFKAFWQKYKIELLLVLAYQALCLISLYVNKHRYADTGEIIQWGLTPIIVQGALPAAVFLFFLPQNHSRFSLSHWRYSWIFPLFIALLIPAVAIWQVIDNQSAYQLYQYSIAGNVDDAPIVRSVLAISTDLGAISALLTIASFYLSVSFLQSQRYFVGFTLLAVTLFNLGGGISSGARVFILMLLAAGVSYLVIMFRKQPRLLLLGGVATVTASLFLVQVAPVHTASKLANLFPFVLPLNLGISFVPSDFIPNFTAASLGERALLWQRAVDQITQNPILGISNGGFRLLGESLGETRINNTHNVVLQSAVDAGLLGLTVLTALFIRVASRADNTFYYLILVVCVIGLLVDNFTDHSLPWMIFSAGTLIIKEYNPLPHGKTRTTISTRKNERFLISIASLCILGILTHYLFERYQNTKLEPKDLVKRIYPVIAERHRHGGSIIISDDIDWDTKDTSRNDITKLFSSIDSKHYCDYLYRQATYIYNRKERTSLDSGRKISDKLTIATHSNEDCALTLTNPLDSKNWVSNHHQYLVRNGRQADNSLRLMYESIFLWSPIIEVSKNSKIQLKASSRAANGIYPTLGITIYDSDTGEAVWSEKEKFVGENTVFTLSPPGNATRVYLRLRLHDYIFDQDNREYQLVELRDFKVE